MLYYKGLVLFLKLCEYSSSWASRNRLIPSNLSKQKSLLQKVGACSQEREPVKPIYDGW